MATKKSTSSEQTSNELELVKGADGGVHLVGTFRGAKLELASVNASQVHEARVAQGLGPDSDDETGADDETTDDPTTDDE